MGTRYEDEVEFSAPAVFSDTVTLPDGAVGNAETLTGANIDAAKLRHYSRGVHTQIGAVAAKTETVFVAYRAGTIKVVDLALGTVPTATDTVTVDVKVSTGGAAFATILTGTYTFSVANAQVARVVYSASLSGTPALVADDLVQVIVTVSGSSGADLVVSVLVDEKGT